MRVRFWGTRGSLPKPGTSTLRYGGNTACVEVRADDGTLVVLDCGSGAHELGRSLRRDTSRPAHGHVLIGHTHWDHIQGFPFFEPLFVPGGAWEVYAPGGRAHHLEAALAGQMSYEYHPVTLDALHADVRFHDLTEGSFDVGGIRVRTQYLNHPVLCLGYRLEADGAVVVYATDHEPYSLHRLDAEPGADPVHHGDQRHVRFLQQADLLIHDAQYALADFPAKAGWGHSPVERVVDYAIAGRVGKVALFHHDPERDDAAVEELEALGRARAAQSDRAPEVIAAREGEELELPHRSVAPRAAIDPGRIALLSSAPRRAATVLIVEDDSDMSELLRTALEAEGVRLLCAGDGESALKLAREERPSLLLLDLNIPVIDGMQVCRSLRGDSDPRFRDIPILILTGTYLSERDLVECFEAGATDYLTKPVKPTLVRSRVRGWLLRTRPD